MQLLTRLASRTISFVLLAAALLLFVERSAHAYIDPGTGSIIFQAVIGAALASLFALKVFWARVKAFVATTLLRRQPKAEVEADDAERF